MPEEHVEFRFFHGNRQIARGNGAYDCVVTMAKFYLDAGMITRMHADPVGNPNAHYVLFRDHIRKSFGDVHGSS